MIESRCRCEGALRKLKVTNRIGVRGWQRQDFMWGVGTPSSCFIDAVPCARHINIKLMNLGTKELLVAMPLLLVASTLVVMASFPATSLPQDRLLRSHAVPGERDFLQRRRHCLCVGAESTGRSTRKCHDDGRLTEDLDDRSAFHRLRTSDGFVGSPRMCGCRAPEPVRFSLMGLRWVDAVPERT